ncbi:receptor-type tyrosine-protein phosphatase eta [Clarias gariepinus]
MINITDLTPGVQYTFRVFAVAGDNKTEGIYNSISAYTKPDVARELNVIEITTSSVFLNWTEPIGKRSFFKVQWGNGSINLSLTTSNTYFNITDLNPGVNYTFLISAVATDDITEGEVFGFSAYTKPETVSNLTVVNVTTSSILLSWPQSMGKISYYVIQYENNNTTINNTAKSTMINITDLTPGVQYTFRVFAVAGDNKTVGNNSYISAYTKPSVARDFNVVEITTSSLFLNWTEPIGKRSFFKVQWSNDSMNLNSTTSNTSFNITDLNPGVNYTFLISAVAADKITEGEVIGLSAYTKPSVVRDLNVTEITTSSVFLNWTEPIGKRSFFKVQWINESITLNLTTSNTSFNITDLNPGVNYTFLISAVAADNITKGEVIDFSAYTKPDTVSNLTAFNVTTSSILLSWIQSMGKISHYVIQYENNNTTITNTAESTMINVTDLTPGVQYTFRVFAVAGDNKTEGIYTCISAYTKPSVARDLNVTEITTSSLFLNWTEPIGKRSFFKVQWSNGNITLNSTTSNTSFNITDLNPGVSYTFLISAVAADNITEGEAIGLSAYTKPGIVRNLSISGVTTTSVNLNWTEPSGESSFFSVQWITGNTSFNSSTSATAFTITNLQPGTNYTFTVSAVAADNKTEGSLVGDSTCTGASPVFNISCEGPNRTATALLNVTWINPPGSNNGFNISLNESFSDFVPFCNPVCNYIFSSNLQYFSSYTVIILTHGCGESGTLDFTCRTGITEPPVPSKPDDVVIVVTAINQTVITLRFNESLLNSTNGPIQAYGVLLSIDPNSDNSSNSLTMTYNDYLQEKTKTYLTVLKRIENSGTRSVDNMIKIELGSNNAADVVSNTNYTNGPLSNQEYSVAMVFFTLLKINRNLVDIDESIFSKTPYSRTTAKPLDPQSNTVAIVLGVLLPIIVLLIIAIIVLVIQKRRISKQYTDIPVTTLRCHWSNPSHFFFIFLICSSIPVRVEEFEPYFKKQQLDSNCGFAEQYEDLKVVGTAQTKNSALAMENKGKNRYNNVLPYDSSRVKLSVQGNPSDDYINANYIAGYNSKKEYIAAQGPLPTTVNEFWRMIWEKHAHTIVMLTKCYEQGRVKCEKYWPQESKLYNNILLTTTSEIELEDWTIRDFTIKNVKTAETRNVRQFHFTAWPDHGVPETTEVLINFRHLVREHMESFSRNAPAVVHCSAGVGRTGTFIALDHLTFQIERESMVDIYGIVHDMRMHRTLMVQTEDQYVFLNQCASDIIKSRTGTNVDLIYQNAAAFSIYENVQR